MTSSFSLAAHGSKMAFVRFLVLLKHQKGQKPPLHQAWVFIQWQHGGSVKKQLLRVGGTTNTKKGPLRGGSRGGSGGSVEPPKLKAKNL